MTLLIDLLIAGGLIGLAIQTMMGASVFRAILMFIVFGLIMALAWGRLHAPDLALAEAAIGAGITGALLLVTWRRLQLRGATGPRAVTTGARWPALCTAVAAGGLVAAIGWAAFSLTPGFQPPGLQASEMLPALGVTNPVTGVLLGFRAYDTLLEMAVLLAAWLGSRAVAAEFDPRTLPGPAHAEVPLVGALLSLVVPISVLVAIYLLQAGGTAPGGAFQAGAVLAAGGVLLCLSGRLVGGETTHPVESLILIAGVAVFSGMGLAMFAIGAPMLKVPGIWAIYLVETALMLSIALTLTLLFASAPGLRQPSA